MLKLVPHLSTRAYAEEFPVHVVGTGAEWRVTENYGWAIFEASEGAANVLARMNELAAEILGRCGGLKGRMPVYPAATLIPYRVIGATDPTPLPLVLSEQNGALIFAVLTDCDPETTT
jgi:hypothetical protein